MHKPHPPLSHQPNPVLRDKARAKVAAAGEEVGEAVVE